MADQFGKGTMAGVEVKGNFMLGLMAGLFAGILGAVLWMNDVAVDLHLHAVAILIGAVVGLAIRVLGHGRSPLYGVMGALLTLGSCLAGEIAAMIFRQVSPQHDLYYIATTANYSLLANAVVSQITPTNYVIYGIAAVISWVLSIAS